MSIPVDSVLFNDLTAANHNDVCRRALCSYNSESGTYSVSVWNNTHRITPAERLIEQTSQNGPSPVSYFGIFIINYLLQVNDMEPVNEWISEKDIPGGTTFFRGPHLIPVDRIANRYTNNPEDFIKQCNALGGTPLNMGDAAFRFSITPRLPIAVIFWDRDDDFPAEAKILFDKSIVSHLTLDIVFALAVDVCHRLENA